MERDAITKHPADRRYGREGYAQSAVNANDERAHAEPADTV